MKALLFPIRSLSLLNRTHRYRPPVSRERIPTMQLLPLQSRILFPLLTEHHRWPRNYIKKLQHRRLRTKPSLSDLAPMIRYRRKYRKTGNFEDWIYSAVEATLVEV